MLSIIAISARFAKIPLFQDMDPRVRGRAYAKEAMQLLQENLIRPSLMTIQACILLSQYLGSEGDVKGKHIYIGLAMLHSQAIRLWEMTRQSNTVSREVCRRTWLSVVICDRWSAADMATSPTYSKKYKDNFPLLDEKEFVELSSSSNGLREILNPSGNGLWAQMAKTIDTFRRISEMIYSLGSNSTSASVQEENVVGLAGQLDTWASELPQRLIYTTENLEYFSDEGFGKTFLAMHIGYHHFRQLLYFPFLDSLRRSSNSRHLTYVELCKTNAMHVSNIADVSFRSNSCHLLYYIIGHILVVSSGVHLHTLLFSNPQEAEQARGHLVSNFEILMRLKTYWPVIDVSVSRLRTFQDDCRKSMTDPFTLDNWMLKFLIEHSAVLDSDRWQLPESGSDSDGQSPNMKAIEPMESTKAEGNTLGSLTALVNDKDLSNDALVENALSWLLD
ncbi:transcriptional regulatory protein [Phlyctema vagabunda]|uniref:Transcriptional regulatory protein n=1 Tax=Phlyctema vagabunda TaxID=108571 RepID=A0ABR4PU23_9HELO